MAQDGQRVDDLIARIQRVVREDVASLLAGAADPRAVAARIRAHLAGLLDEAEAALHALRGEAERWRAARSRAEQAAAVETQLALLASRDSRSAVVVAAQQRARQHQ